MNLEGFQILIADDQPDVAQTLCEPLRSNGAVITFVIDGEAALSKIHGGGYDLLLLDIKMPPGEAGGIWLLEQLSKSGTLIPVIVLSGEGGLSDTKRAMRLGGGAVDWVDKDMAAVELEQRCSEALTKGYIAAAQANAKVVANQQHCAIGELLASGRENSHLEYKSTLRTDAGTGTVNKALETVCIKTVAAFANSGQGGTLLIGVTDGGSIHGLASDYDSLRKPGRDNRDVFELHLNQLLINSVGAAATTTVSVRIEPVDDKDVCRVHVPPSNLPVYARLKFEKAGQMRAKTAFYIRVGNSTREITEGEWRKYVASRWGQGMAAEGIEIANS